MFAFYFNFFPILSIEANENIGKKWVKKNIDKPTYETLAISSNETTFHVQVKRFHRTALSRTRLLV